MSDNIFETLQTIQNERFAQSSSVFNDSVTVRAIEKELEAKRKEWRKEQDRAKYHTEQAKKLDQKKNLTAEEERWRGINSNQIRASMERMKQLEREANELKAMSEDERAKWTMQRRLQATLKKYQGITISIDRRGKEVAAKTRYSNFIPDNALRRMSRTELEWLIAEASTVRPMVQQIDKDFGESEKLYKIIKPKHDQIQKMEMSRGGGRLVLPVDPELSRLAVEVRDIERSQIEMNRVKRAYGHIIEQGRRAKKILDSLPRETSIANSAMVAFQ
jgi:hypothetical protein